MKDTQRFLGTDEAAKRLDTSQQSIRRWIRNGTLKGHKKAGRYRAERADVKRLQSEWGLVPASA